jgi:hypothetical protein
MIYRLLLLLGINLGFLTKMSGQLPFPDSLVTVEWELAGVRDSIPTYGIRYNFKDFLLEVGGDADRAYKLFLDTWDRAPATLFFDPDSFYFFQPLVVPSLLVIQGAGSSQTCLVFDFAGASNAAIQFRGTLSATNAIPEVGWYRGDQHITMQEALDSSAWYFLDFDDSSLITSSWASRTSGALYYLSSFGESRSVTTHTPLRIGVDTALSPRFRLVHPVENSGIECLSIIRKDATIQQSSTILMDLAVNCWVLGVVSSLSNFAHIDIRRSTHLTIRGNYLQDAHAFGGGGQGYGVVLQYGTSLCEVSNTILRRLRHAVLLQAGANGNVIAYNYSIEPFWNQSGLPSNSAGDMVCHGNYPYLNLFEGNVCQNIVVDASHGRNGPHNYFLRNRADTYGIFMSPGSGTDSTHFIGNEVTNQVFLQGLYSLIGSGNIEYGNRVRGTIRPANTTLDFPKSLYLSDQPPTFWQDGSWPRIGINNPSISNRLPARDNFDSGIFTDCTKNHSGTLAVYPFQFKKELPILKIFPNPSSTYINIESTKVGDRLLLVGSAGSAQKLSTDAGQLLYIGHLAPGYYQVTLLNSNNQAIATGSFIKL